MTLQDGGKISGYTSGDQLTLAYGLLTLLDNVSFSSTDRINNSLPIISYGGTLNFTGRDNTASSETVGNVTLAQGFTSMSVTNGGGVVRSADLILGNLTVSNDATFNFSGINGTPGSSARITAANGTTLLVNNIIPWTNGGNTWLASYNDQYGFGPLVATGMAGYDGTDFTTLGATKNIHLTANTFALPDVGGAGTAGVSTLNAFSFAATVAGQGVTFADNADILSLPAIGVSTTRVCAPRELSPMIELTLSVVEPAVLKR